MTRSQRDDRFKPLALPVLHLIKFSPSRFALVHAVIKEGYPGRLEAAWEEATRTPSQPAGAVALLGGHALSICGRWRRVEANPDTLDARNV